MFGDTNELSILVSMQNKASADIAKLKSDLAGLGNQGSLLGNIFTGFGNTFSTEISMITSVAKYAAVGIAGLAATTVALGIKATQTAANLEAERMGFITLLGSAEKADDILAKIKKDAAETPFELPGLIQANKLLTSVTKDGDRSEKMLLNVGKALSAMGKGQPELDRIIINLQQIGAVGKASLMDIRQFAFAGIPIFEMLTEATGKSGEALGDMISDGQITFELLEKMFAKAGEEGGRFENAFKNMQGTFTQLMSNMFDNLNILGAQIITQSGLFDIFKGAIGGVTEWVNKNNDAIVAWVKNAVELVRTKIADWIEQMGGKEGLKQKFIDFWSTLTTQVIPAIENLILKIIDVIKWVKDNWDWIWKLIAAYEAFKLLMFTGGVLKLLGTIATSFLTMSGEIAGATAATSTFGKVLLGLPTSIVIIIGIASILAAIEAAYKLNAALNDLDKAQDDFASNQSKAIENARKYKESDPEKYKRQMDVIQQSANENAKAQKEFSDYMDRVFSMNPITSISATIFGKERGGYIRGRATGGHPSMDEMTLVGEAGPELLKLPIGSKVIPNSEIGGMGGSTIFNFNFAGAVISNKNDLIKEIINAVNRKAELRQLGSSV